MGEQERESGRDLSLEVYRLVRALTPVIPPPLAPDAFAFVHLYALLHSPDPLDTLLDKISENISC